MHVEDTFVFKDLETIWLHFLCLNTQYCDEEMRKKLIEERQFLKAWGFTPENDDLVIFWISKGEAYFWTMETNFDSKTAIKFG